MLRNTEQFQISMGNFSSARGVKLLNCNFPFRGRWLAIQVREEKKLANYLVDIKNPDNKIELDENIVYFHSVSFNKFLYVIKTNEKGICKNDFQLVEVNVQSDNLTLNELKSKELLRCSTVGLGLIAISPNAEFLVFDGKFIHIPSGKIIQFKQDSSSVGFIGDKYCYRDSEVYLTSTLMGSSKNPAPLGIVPYAYLSFSPSGKLVIGTEHNNYGHVYVELLSLDLNHKPPLTRVIGGLDTMKFHTWLPDDRLLVVNRDDGLCLYEDGIPVVLKELPTEKPISLLMYNDNKKIEYTVIYINEIWGKFEIYLGDIENKLLKELNTVLVENPPEINAIITSYLPSFFPDTEVINVPARELNLLDEKIESYEKSIEENTAAIESLKNKNFIRTLFSNQDQIELLNKTLSHNKEICDELKALKNQLLNGDKSMSYEEGMISLGKKYGLGFKM